MVSREEAKRLIGRAEECLALSEVVSDPQAQHAYAEMAKAYRKLAGEAPEKRPLLAPISQTKKVRRRIQPTLSLQDRLASFAKEAGEKALQLPPGPEREELLKKVRLAETASHLDEWVNSPGLQPPK